MTIREVIDKLTRIADELESQGTREITVQVLTGYYAERDDYEHYDDVSDIYIYDNLGITTLRISGMEK